MNQKLFEVLRAIKEDKEVSDRDAVDTLVDSGYLNKDLRISQKGEDFLQKHRVDNAIIIAAGLGTRFVPHTMFKPKGLIEVLGEPLVERQIKQLRAAGIREIVLVVGYLKEHYQYLEDKYDVILLENKDYNHMNNISSLYVARSYLKNSYLIPSDIRLKDNCYHQYEYQSWYAGRFFEDDTEEWALTYDEDLRINGLSEKNKGVWAMYGPAFLNQTFSEKFLDFVEEDYHNSSKKHYFWENTYLDHIDELDLYLKKFNQDAVVEFESFAELRAFDQSYWEDSRNPIIKKIARVFEVKESEITDIELLEKGMTNKSFIFKVNNKKYVFRQPGMGSEKLINRYQEAEVYEVVAPLGITDEIVYMNPEKGVKITVYYEDSRASSSESKEDLKASLDLYKILHQAELSVQHEFDLRERIAYYQTLVTEVKGFYPENFKEVLKQNELLLDYLDGLERPHILCHIDSVESNVLKIKDGSYRLIDWEYAGMADPMIDLAAYVIYTGYEEEEIDFMLHYYLEREPSEEEYLVMYSYVSLMALLWALWAWYKEEFGNDYKEYADSQYHYAMKYSKKVLDVLYED